MKFRVEITRRAESDIQGILEWLCQESVAAADRWLTDLSGCMRSLEEFPLRCPVAQEDSGGLRPIRNLLRGNYRVLFIVEAEVVRVLHVRDARRHPASPGDLSN